MLARGAREPDDADRRAAQLVPQRKRMTRADVRVLVACELRRLGYSRQLELPIARSVA